MAMMHAVGKPLYDLKQKENSPELYTNSYLIFVNEVSKMLLEAGVTERQLHKMTVDNPRRLFECNAQ